MARRLSSREVALIGGLAALAGWWMWRSWHTTAEAPAAVVRKADPRGPGAIAIPAVHLDQLDKPLIAYDPDGRDLFRYAPRPPSWAEVRRLKAEAEAARKAQLEAQKRAEEEAKRKALEEAQRQAWLRDHPQPPPPPIPPRVPFQYIGFIGPPTDRIAAFQLNDETFLAKTGEVVKKDFKVKEIRYESVILAYTDPKFKDTAELPLSRGK